MLLVPALLVPVLLVPVLLVPALLVPEHVTARLIANVTVITPPPLEFRNCYYY